MPAPAANPSLAQCPWYQERSALAWAVQPADPSAGVPAIVFKDGGVAGSSTEVALMPQAGLGVVVFVNSRSFDRATGMPERPAVPIARNILYALFQQRLRWLPWALQPATAYAGTSSTESTRSG